jgi:serine/threonine-protein kinase
VSAGRAESIVGKRLGELEILHALKAGGMGEVLLARRRGVGGFEQLCAVKIIRAELASAPLVRTMFLDEARLLARLTHPAIAQILDFGEHDGAVYMAMEYVAGEHFRRFAERKPPATIVCQAVAAACRGLHAAHELRDVGDGHLLGVVHRDISPDNLMLGFDGRVKVLDFGIALAKGRQAPATEYGTLKGKPPYMSPEQLRNQELDRRADVFSICVVLHELLTGAHLFAGDSIYAVAHAVEHQAIEPPSVLAGPLPAELDDVVMAGLERLRDRRLRSAAALADALERIAAASGGESLAAWAERELARERDDHRRWLSQVVTGTRVAPAGRPTGVMTALAEPVAVTLAGGGDDRAGGGDGDGDVGRDVARDVARGVDGDDGRDVGRDVAGDVGDAGALAPGTQTMPRAPTRPSRRRWRAALAVLVLAIAVALAILLLGRDRRPAIAERDLDATPAPLPVTVADGGPPVVDAAAIIDVPRDAAPAPVVPPPIDPRRARDAGEPRPREPRDGGPVSVHPTDASTTPSTPTGGTVDAGATGKTGFLTAGSHPVARVIVDGVEVGTTPMLRRRIAAGRHAIVFLDDVNGLVLLRRTIDLAPGTEAKVVYPEHGP